MKLPLLLTLALVFSACEKAVPTPDPTPAPTVAGKPGAAATPPGSPAPKPGAWMHDSKSSLDKSGKLGAKGKK